MLSADFPFSGLPLEATRVPCGKQSAIASPSTPTGPENGGALGRPPAIPSGASSTRS
ncbi:hypothetical protein CGCFRS4_v016022 [Colletotrichum fructicola]|nr:hypothetical protein CGCFRS4_v016022 [Colletotrichum fructicola]